MSSLTETLIPAAPEVVTPERVTPLRPSEALRLGRLTRPVRLRGRYLRGTTAACALGAIAVGAGLPVADFNSSDLLRRFPGLSIGHVAILNDEGASDDEILAYLEGLGL